MVTFIYHLFLFKNMGNGFNIRFEDYNQIHSNSDEDWIAFMKTLNPKKEETILDAAGGYGDVSRHILDLCKPTIYVIDNSQEQLDRLREKHLIPNEFIKFGDIRKIDFPDNFFDSVILKMGVHEVPKEDQIKIFNEIFRILKPKGKFVTWELALSDDNQEFFQKTIRKKDELSGFQSMKENRYFPKHSETIQNFKSSGFKKIKDTYTKYYHPDPKLRFHELVSKERAKLIKKKGNLSKEDQKKLDELSVQRIQELSNYIKSILTEKIKKAVHFKETESGIDFVIEKKIYVGYKILG